MKKYSSLLRTLGIILVVLALYHWLSMSDVLRLNPDLEAGNFFTYNKIAHETSINNDVSVLILADQLPEQAKDALGEATDPFSMDATESITVGEQEYSLITWDQMVAYGGKLTVDKYGAPKLLEDEISGASYAQGKVQEKGLLWDHMGWWGQYVTAVSPAVIPVLVVGVVLLLLGMFGVSQQKAAQNKQSLGEYLMQVAGPKRLAKIISENAIIVGIVLLAIGVSIARPAFLSEANFRNLISNTAVRFIIAVGVSGCLITKGTDLSAGRMAGFAACLSAIFLQRSGDYANKFYPGLGDLPIIPVLLGVMLLCGALGAINGTVISVLKVPPFIATLGMQTLVYGICLVYTGAQPIGTLQSAYTGIAMGYVGNRMFSYIFLIALAVGILMWFLYNKTRYGKYMYAIGGNETAAEVAGINTTKAKIKIYTLAAVMYALTGFLMAAKSGGASVNTAQGYELEAIAGCTIGGVSVNGGVGKISGILIGVLVFELLKIALQFLGVESSYTYIAQGLVIIVAVALDLRKYLQKK